MHIYTVPAGAGVDTWYVSIVVLWFVSVGLCHLWPAVFFTMRSPKWALFLTVLLLCTAGATCAFYAVVGSWVSFGAFLPYIIWLAVALYLNARWVAEIKPLHPTTKVDFASSFKDR
jgi:tryptophan-rich sensory protein